MRRIIKVAMVVLVGLMLVTAFLISSGGEEERYLSQAVIRSGAKVISSEISTFGRLLSKSSDKAMLDIKKELLKKFCLTVLSDKHIVSEALDRIEMYGKSKDGLFIRYTGHCEKEEDGNVAATFCLEVTKDSSIEKLRETKLMLESILGAHQIKSDTNIFISGVMPKSVSGSDLTALSCNILESAKATEVDRLSQDGLFSINAFSPCIGQNVYSSYNKSNFNVAFKKSKYNEQTYIYLAVPFINREF